MKIQLAKYVFWRAEVVNNCQFFFTIADTIGLLYWLSWWQCHSSTQEMQENFTDGDDER